MCSFALVHLFIVDLASAHQLRFAFEAPPFLLVYNICNCGSSKLISAVAREESFILSHIRNFIQALDYYGYEVSCLSEKFAFSLC